MKILVIYFSQSGQILDIAKNLFREIDEKSMVDYAPIELERPFPFPWTASTFFDAMPESVKQMPSAIKPLPDIQNKDYDLIVFGYQPWFLHPSIPANSFLKSEWASVLKGKPVITLIGCRNMWLNAQEKVKQLLQEIGAHLVGNIVLEDKHANLTSTLTIVRWLFKGQKEASKYLPAAGVSEKDIKETARFGSSIYKHFQNQAFNTLHETLLQQGAVRLRPQLIVLEKRGISQFPKWANRALKKGEPGSADRMKVIKTFQRLLFVAIFILSPITDLVAKIQTRLKLKKLKKEVGYFSGVTYIPNKL